MSVGIVIKGGGILIKDSAITASDDPCKCCSEPPCDGRCPPGTVGGGPVDGGIACCPDSHPFHQGNCLCTVDDKFIDPVPCVIVCDPLQGVWYVDCYSFDGSAECVGCNAGPFMSDAQANDWSIANPPPAGCEYTLVYMPPAQRNPLP